MWMDLIQSVESLKNKTGFREEEESLSQDSSVNSCLRVPASTMDFRVASPHHPVSPFLEISVSLSLSLCL